MSDERDVLGKAGAYPDQPPVAEEGRPILATVIGSLVVLLTAGGPAGSGASSADPAEAAAYRLGEFVGGALVVALIVWGIAYAITIRRASRRWKIASFVILLLVSTLVSLVRIGAREVAKREDMAVVSRQIEQAMRGGEAPVTVEPGDGPMGAMSAAYLNRTLAERRSFQRRQQAAGTDAILDFAAVTPAAPALRNCGRFAELAAAARGNAGRFEAHAAAARSAGDPFVARGALSEADRDEFLQGLRSTRDTHVRYWEIAAEWAGEVNALCGLLAGRPWRREDGTVAFGTDADAAAANRHLARIDALVAQHVQLERANRERVAQGSDSPGAASPSAGN
jgi:hypothetical protein